MSHHLKCVTDCNKLRVRRDNDNCSTRHARRSVSLCRRYVILNYLCSGTAVKLPMSHKKELTMFLLLQGCILDTGTVMLSTLVSSEPLFNPSSGCGCGNVYISAMYSHTIMPIISQNTCLHCPPLGTSVWRKTKKDMLRMVQE